jgi:glutamine amidotransferase
MVGIAIVDYGVGNLHSIQRGLELAGAQTKVTHEPAEIAAADAIVLPGVGAFKSAMQELGNNIDIIRQTTSVGKPLLGICLGMQLLLTWSEEGGHTKGLGLIPGKVVKLPHIQKVPHMGWNFLKIEREHPFLAGIQSGTHVYFVHSYFVRPEDEATVFATTVHGIEFPAVVARGLVIGTQFHPEKSGGAGLQMLRNFVGIAESTARRLDSPSVSSL